MLKISDNFDLISVDEVPQCSPPTQGAGLTSVPVTEFIRTLLMEISRIIVFNIYIIHLQLGHTTPLQEGVHLVHLVFIVWEDGGAFCC